MNLLTQGYGDQQHGFLITFGFGAVRVVVDRHFVKVLNFVGSLKQVILVEGRTCWK